jgi:hypothetical protein
MIVCVLTCLIKQFFFMRVREDFSNIVTMIMSVVYDLRVFLTFYFLLILYFSMIFNIISQNSDEEYRGVGSVIGNFLATVRLSLGDFGFDLLGDMATRQVILYWIIWMFMVGFSNLIFLNFIIAEVSNSYQNVKDTIDQVKYKERASLVAEIEMFVPLK